MNCGGSPWYNGDMDRPTAERIRKHLTDMQRHLEQALYDAEQAEGCGAAPLPRRSIEEVLEVLSVRLLPDEG